MDREVSNQINAVLLLRNYQLQLVQSLDEAVVASRKAILLQSPTGSGKGVILAYLAHRAAEANQRVLIVTHRDELLRQIVTQLAREGQQAGVIKRGWSEQDDLIQVSTVQTIARRKQLPQADVLLIDEAHHSPAAQYLRLVDAYAHQGALRIGFTATPIRLDGQGFSDIFEVLIVGPSIPSLVADGHLAPTRFYSVARQIEAPGKIDRTGDYALSALEEVANQPELVADLVQEWQRLAKGKRTVVFSVGRTHSESITQQYLHSGIPAAHIHGGQDPQLRQQLVSDFAAGKLLVLVNCELISEGFDLPQISCVQLARPTLSLSRYLQMVGRVMRSAPGKEYGIILDHAGNVYRHDLPEAERHWSLEGARTSSLGLKTCPQCGLVVPAEQEGCDCGYTWLRSAGRVVVFIPHCAAGKLVEVPDWTGLRARAIDLASTGVEYAEIARNLNVSTAIVSRWMHQIGESARRRNQAEARWEEALEALRSGDSLKAVCKKYGCNLQRLSYRAKVAGISLTPSRKEHTEEVKAQALQLLVEGKHPSQVSKELGLARVTVARWFKDVGYVPPRTEGLNEKQLELATNLLRSGVSAAQVAKELELPIKRIYSLRDKLGLSVSQQEIESHTKSIALAKLRDGIECKAIAQQLGRHPKTVRKWAIEAGIDPSPKRFSAKEWEHIKSRAVTMLKNGLPAKQVAHELEVDERLVASWKERLDLQVKPHYTREQKTAAVEALRTETIMALSQSTGIPGTTLYGWAKAAGLTPVWSNGQRSRKR